MKAIAVEERFLSVFSRGDEVEAVSRRLEPLGACGV